MAEISPEDLEEFLTGRQLAYPNEEDAFQFGAYEFYRRAQAAKDEKLSAAANLALPDAKEWIQYLYRQKRENWGFICLYDAAAQRLDPARLNDFELRKDFFFRHARMYKGSKDIIDSKWRLFNFNAPNIGFAPITSTETDYQDGTILRKAFQEILKDPQEYQKAEDVIPRNTPTQYFENGITGSGLLTNTFLVIDPVCINSVLGHEGHWYDNRRVLAFEADFPVQGRKYIEGYQGFTWVRLDQLVYHFYELRLLKANEVGMDKIWKAAQESRHQAFVSMDPEEASSFTISGELWGFTRDSVLGRRWYAVRDARQEQNRLLA
jgi:hypothetical protein